MSKLIYVDRLKKDVLDLPNCYNGFSDTYDKACIIGVIDEQPTIEERKWIPCSERLPKSRETVIVSICDETGDTKYDYTSHGWLTSDNEYWIVDDEINNYVVAWMPLPKSYTEGTK